MFPLRPLLPQRWVPLNCHRSPLYPLLPQRSASRNWSYAPFTPFSIKGQHHSSVLCPPSTPSQSKVSTTHLSSVSLYPLLPQRAASLNCHTPPLLLSQSNASITQLSYVTTLPPSQSKVSVSQLSCVPVYPLLSQRSTPLNCPMSPLYPLLSLRSASLNCHMPLSNPFSMQGQHHSIVMCPHPPSSPSMISTTQLS